MRDSYNVQGDKGSTKSSYRILTFLAWTSFVGISNNTPLWSEGHNQGKEIDFQAFFSEAEQRSAVYCLALTRHIDKSFVNMPLVEYFCECHLKRSVLFAASKHCASHWIGIELGSWESESISV